MMVLCSSTRFLQKYHQHIQNAWIFNIFYHFHIVSCSFCYFVQFLLYSVIFGRARWCSVVLGCARLCSVGCARWCSVVLGLLGGARWCSVVLGWARRVGVAWIAWFGTKIKKNNKIHKINSKSMDLCVFYKYFICFAIKHWFLYKN